MARNLDIMQKEFPKEYSFYPATYVLPQSFATFKSLFPPNGQSKVTYIIKPSGGAQGKGIFLTRKLEDVENLGKVCVAQPYITNPLLIDKKKFDLRIYVLVTSCSPLRVYIFRDGLVRICAEEYECPNAFNMDDRCMHLTNYAVNKHSEKYERDDRESTAGDLGCKRSIKWFLAWLREEKGETAASNLWSKIGDICALTIMSILPLLQREYSATFERKVSLPSPDILSTEPSGGSHATNANIFSGRSRCFEILGYDIMVDSDLKPILIEVNHLPSWGTDSPVDQDVKFRAITQALSAINVNAQDKKYFESEKRKQSQAPPAMRGSGGFSDDTGSNNQPKGAVRPTKGLPALFDSQKAERRIRIIYEKHAPEKLPTVNDLLSRYSGYEEWLAMKIEQKYNENDNKCDTRTEETFDNEPRLVDEGERQRLDDEERILIDYERIYPPSDKAGVSLARYNEMETFAALMDEKQHQRLTCPSQQKYTDCDVENQTPGQSNRRDSWLGNIPRATMDEIKISRPPTKKQIESADRLSRGYSVEDTEVGEKNVKKTSPVLHPNFMYEEENLRLVDRVQQSQEHSKEVRKRAETKLNTRSSKSGTALKQQVISLGLEAPVVTEENYKFYGKRV